MDTKRIIPITIDYRLPTQISTPQVQQFDTNQFLITVNEDGKAADLSNVDRIVLNYKRPDGLTVSKLLTAEENVITYQMGREEMEVTGVGQLNVQMFSSDTRISSSTFKVYIFEIPAAQFDGNNGYPLLQELFMEVTQVSEESQANSDYALNSGDYAKAQAQAVNQEIISLDELKTEMTTAKESAESAAVTATNSSNEADTKALYAKEQGDFAKAEYERLKDTDVSKLTVELAEKAYDKGTDLVELLQSYSGLNDNVYVKASPTSLDIAIFYSENKATVYTLKQDGDSWFRLFDVVVKSMSKSSIMGDWNSSENFETKTGTWNTSSMPHYYATQVGATFSGGFTGTGFYFNRRIDDRGGVWEFVVDGYITKRISNWASTTQDYISAFVIGGLSPGRHTYVATFLGDDPDHVPSSGAGTARGWASYFTGTNRDIKKTITPIVETYTDGGTGTPVMQASSRKEFAYSVKPEGAAYGSEWVPEHSVLGVMKDLTYKIFLGDREVVGISQESTFYKPFKSVKIATTYKGYHPQEPSALWNGRIDQTINSKGYHVKGKFEFLQDVRIGVGHPAMLAIDKTTTENNRVVTGKGNRYVLPEGTNDNSDVNLQDVPGTIAHFNFGSTNPQLQNLVATIKIHDVEKTLRLGEEGQALMPTYVRLRSDGHRKFYAKSHEDYLAKTGEIYTFGSSYSIGEIFNASDILA
jgi:hypothetical protein